MRQRIVVRVPSYWQGDQMSLGKNAQILAQSIFAKMNTYIDLTVGKIYHKILSTLEIRKKTADS
jgi:hypothetical protein